MGSLWFTAATGDFKRASRSEELGGWRESRLGASPCGHCDPYSNGLRLFSFTRNLSGMVNRGVSYKKSALSKGKEEFNTSLI